MGTGKLNPPPIREMSPRELLRHEFIRRLLMTPVTDDTMLAVNRQLAKSGGVEFEDVIIALFDAYANRHVGVGKDAKRGKVFYDTSGVHNKVVD